MLHWVNTGRLQKLIHPKPPRPNLSALIPRFNTRLSSSSPSAFASIKSVYMASLQSVRLETSTISAILRYASGASLQGIAAKRSHAPSCNVEHSSGECTCRCILARYSRAAFIWGPRLRRRRLQRALWRRTLRGGAARRSPARDGQSSRLAASPEKRAPSLPLFTCRGRYTNFNSCEKLRKLRERVTNFPASVTASRDTLRGECTGGHRNPDLPRVVRLTITCVTYAIRTYSWPRLRRSDCKPPTRANVPRLTVGRQPDNGINPRPATLFIAH